MDDKVDMPVKIGVESVDLNEIISEKVFIQLIEQKKSNRRLVVHVEVIPSQRPTYPKV